MSLEQADDFVDYCSLPLFDLKKLNIRSRIVQVGSSSTVQCQLAHDILLRVQEDHEPYDITIARNALFDEWTDQQSTRHRHHHRFVYLDPGFTESINLQRVSPAPIFSNPFFTPSSESKHGNKNKSNGFLMASNHFGDVPQSFFTYPSAIDYLIFHGEQDDTKKSEYYSRLFYRFFESIDDFDIFFQFYTANHSVLIVDLTQPKTNHPRKCMYFYPVQIVQATVESKQQVECKQEPVDKKKKEQMESNHPLLANVAENDDVMSIYIQVPDIKRDQIQISGYVGLMRTISVKVRESVQDADATNDLLKKEWIVQLPSEREFLLSPLAQVHRTRVHLEHGILHLTIPKEKPTIFDLNVCIDSVQPKLTIEQSVEQKRPAEQNVNEPVVEPISQPIAEVKQETSTPVVDPINNDPVEQPIEETRAIELQDFKMLQTSFISTEEPADPTIKESKEQIDPTNQQSQPNQTTNSNWSLFDYLK